MNKGDHVLNALLLGIGIGVLLDPSLSVDTLSTIGMVTIPVVVGALFPDVDTAFGTHRQTLHNALVLAGFVLFPVFYGNLYYVWIGIATHFVLDLLGTQAGIAVLYPYDGMFDVPVGVNVDSNVATLVTVLVTGVELVAVAGLIRFGYGDLLRAPALWDVLVGVLP
ncbi:metal-dependent hydrolase [Haloparvum sp. PAK95]|uniref:metal-dependent hydrolase n=1 Tax=Haloparvum sp. PAK95 TaxID=3418962 RepID=UPI003D2F1837